MKFRLLPLTVDKAVDNMAIDEAILKSVAKGKSSPTLRFYRWSPSAVSIGCFQSFEYEVDADRASSEGVDVVRRISGGGSVFHDYQGELTYSFISELDHVPDDVVESFRKICGALVKGFKFLGLEARYSEVNDVMVGDKKISGSAQTRRYDGFLQHGTILINPDIRRMFKLLKVSPEKITDKFISSVYKRVTSISNEIGRIPGFSEVRAAMINGFERIFENKFAMGELSDREKTLARKLREKYASSDWTRKR